MTHAARLLSALPILLLAPGCSRSEPEPDSALRLPFDGQAVTVRVPAGHGLPARFELIVDEWSNRTGASARIIESSPEEQSSSETAGAEVVLFPITDIADRAAAGKLLPIPAELRSEADLDWLDVFQGLRDRVCSVERSPVVVPLSCPVLVCYYRRDLLEQGGLSPPRTWSEYEELVDSLESWAPGLTAVEPWDEDYRATMFLARAVSYVKAPGQYSVFFDIDTGEPLVGTPGYVRALEVSQSLLAKMPEAVASFSPDDCRREFLTGRAALAIAFETAAAESGTTERRLAGFSAGFTRLPAAERAYSLATSAWTEQTGSVPFAAFGGLCAGVSADATASDRSRQSAWNLLATLAVDQREAAFPPHLLSPCRHSQLEEPSRWAGAALVESESANYLQAVAESVQDTTLVAELPVVGRNRFREALTRRLSSVLSGDRDPQDALQSAAAQWEEIAAELGAESVRDSYRRSLGLPPARR